jgi:hypothetical protein
LRHSSNEFFGFNYAGAENERRSAAPDDDISDF